MATTLNVLNFKAKSKVKEDFSPINHSVDVDLLHIHYAVAIILLAFYGVAVCPFIDELPLPHLVAPISATFILMALARQLLWQKLVEVAPLERKTSTIFKLDMALFLFFGLLLASHNYFFYDFPLESGVKIIVGMLSIGWFVSVDIALYNERCLSLFLKKIGVHLRQSKRYISLTKKFTVFAFISLSVVAVTLLLVVYKDVGWIIAQGDEIVARQAQILIMLEFLFVLGILLVYLLKIIQSYSKSSDFFLKNQNQTLIALAEGDLSVSVPVTSNDEYGIMANLTNAMIDELVAQKREIQQTRDTTILALSSLAETRDNETGAHILRTKYYVKALAEELSQQPKFAAKLSPDMIVLMYKSAPLHDIGKVGIPDKILLKPGKLDFDEFEIMKTHAALGGQAIRAAEEQMGGTSFLNIAKEIAESHHEKWDGSGYPNGLKGEEIPLSARLMALADVYDALISKRVYKEAFSHERAKGIILEGDGKHFDTDVIKAFLVIEDKFLTIAKTYKN